MPTLINNPFKFFQLTKQKRGKALSTSAKKHIFSFDLIIWEGPLYDHAQFPIGVLRTPPGPLYCHVLDALSFVYQVHSLPCQMAFPSLASLDLTRIAAGSLPRKSSIAFASSKSAHEVRLV